MVDYLDRIGAGLIIAHPEMLDFDYVPDELVGREDVQRELASKFSNVASPEGAARAVITGPVGSGKTVLAKTFCRDLQRHLSGKRELKVAHINCRNASTSMRVAQRILHQFDPGHPDRGLSLGEMLLSLRKMLRRTSTHLIVVLDEVDHMLRRSGDELLYQLLRIDEDQEGTGTISLMLISQEQVLDVLETAAISKFGQSNHLAFPPTRWTDWKRLRPSELNLPSFQGPTPKRPFASSPSEPPPAGMLVGSSSTSALLRSVVNSARTSTPNASSPWKMFMR